ncbi:uncharacterized protein B0H18DRAFT_1214013 [Fomitopsis serialis]|uniref:uncharacterized protein n=1 Tax=Fomitopsis serialis TaxID=139415 RepID=UPI002007BFD2|nr:uncharacterized protein B0H18DRAFT_1214013 [Neoantrodia serialis]KAH9919041.1 hypothetical protein B0H18DRAFT_1214013 [Neoantrodia serialis]
MLARIATRSARRSVPVSRPSPKKEKAHEDQFARQHEAEQLKKLKAELEKKKAELAQLEKEHEELSKKQ